MKKLLVFSVSILCLSLALAIVLHQLGEFAIASSTAPSPTEVTTAAGITVPLSGNTATTIPWPTYADGTQATLSECVGITTPTFFEKINTLDAQMGLGHQISGLDIGNVGITSNTFVYLIVCTRSAAGAVAAEQSTWGEIKSLYGE